MASEGKSFDFSKVNGNALDAAQMQETMGGMVYREIRNYRLAGKIHPETKVPFDANGLPDFSDYLFKGGPNDIMIKPTGNRLADFNLANKAAGYSSTPKGYTWHHHQNNGRMQLVETDIQFKTGHTGGFSIWDF